MHSEVSLREIFNMFFRLCLHPRELAQTGRMALVVAHLGWVVEIHASGKMEVAEEHSHRQRSKGEGQDQEWSPAISIRPSSHHWSLQ